MSKIVLGCLFGDEGKGLVTRWLAKKSSNPLIIRFSGGPQSAHTVISKETGVTHVCSSFGSGVLEGTPTYYRGGYFDLCSYVKECEVLEDKGIEIPPIYIGPSPRVKMMYPHDVYLGRKGAREKRDGTCGKGIYQAFKRPDYDDDKYALTEYWKFKGLSEKDISELWEIYDTATRSKYVQGISRVFPSMDDFSCIVEGTQGLLLDKDFGFFPNVTPSSTGLGGVRENFEIKYNDEVWLVIRSYLTRHGKGYTPKNSIPIVNPYETNVFNEWQGEFKVGKMEPDLIRRAIDRHSLDNWQKMWNLTVNVVITCLDVYVPENLEEIKKAFTDNLEINEFYGSYSPWSDEILPL